MGLLVLILMVIVGIIVLSSLLQFALWLIVPVLLWAFTGWLAGRLLNRTNGGFLENVLLGLLGGIVAGILFNPAGLIGQLIFGTLGAAIVIFIANLVNSRRTA
ncbi:MAG: hypothetical protein SF162_07860 [bacterium]|nr:hypothetical protein [bacterium]